MSILKINSWNIIIGKIIEKNPFPITRQSKKTNKTKIHESVFEYNLKFINFKAMTITDVIFLLRNFMNEIHRIIDP